MRGITEKQVNTFFLSTFILILGTIGLFGIYPSVKASPISCLSFDSYEDAYLTFSRDPVTWKRLDRDRDGKPCELLIINL